MRFGDLIALASAKGRGRVAVVGAADPAVLAAARRASDTGVAEPILIGAPDAIRAAAAAGGVDLRDLTLLPADDERGAASAAAALVRTGEIEAILKGAVHTSTLMQVGLREGFKREGRFVSHVALIDVPQLGRTIAVTDSALTPYPTLEQRVEIVRNAGEFAKRLGTTRPMIALLSASEEVNPKIPSSIDAARIAEMARPGGPLEGVGAIEGPLDLGCAIDAETARIKGVGGEVVGRADVIVAPDIVSANTLSKALIYLGHGDLAACAVGGSVPIGMVSRASPTRDKLNALLLALACR
jgi:phosphate acetyltransferase